MPDAPASAAGAISAISTIGQSAPSFQIHIDGVLVTTGRLRGRWLMIASLPSDATRCREVTALLQAQEAFRRRGILVAVLVEASAGDADLLRATADHHGEPGFLGVIADPERIVATACGLVDDAGRVQAATLVIAPDGVICGLVRHRPGDRRCLDSLLVVFDTLRAGWAGCAVAGKDRHV